MLKRTVLICLLLIPALALASPKFKEGKDYKILKGTPAPQGHLVTMTEFFSFGCPACFHFEPNLERWLEKKPKTVIFKRMPVIFRDSWVPFARAFFIAKKLGVEETMVPVLFKAAQVSKADFNDNDTLRELFVNHGVSAEDFDTAASFAPELSWQITHSKHLMKKYSIYVIPTMIINGKYMTNPQMVNSNEARFFEVINFLIVKAAEEQQAKR